MPVMCPICFRPLPSGLQLVRRGVGWRVRKEENEREEKKEEIIQRQAEEKKVLSSNYYPPEPIYILNNKDQPPTVVKNLIQAPETPEKLNRTNIRKM